MRPRLRLFLVAAALAVLLLPAAAQARLTVGISENDPAMFTDPLFGGLGAEHARVIVPYDVMTSGDHQLGRITWYLNAAREAGVEPRIAATSSSSSRRSRGRGRSPLKRALKVPRAICGIHNYSDVNRFRDTGTRVLTKALGCRQVWLTETGGLYDFASFWTKRTRKGCKTAAACQLKATKYMFALARRNPRVKRLYVYSYFGNVTPCFDAGLVDSRSGKPRPAYREVRKRS